MPNEVQDPRRRFRYIAISILFIVGSLTFLFVSGCSFVFLFTPGWPIALVCLAPSALLLAAILQGWRRFRAKYAFNEPGSNSPKEDDPK
jgi:hypothetical protein